MSTLLAAVENSCPDHPDNRHINQFRELGYVAFEGLLTTEEVQAAKDELQQIVTRHLSGARSGQAEYRPAKPEARTNYDGATIRFPNSRCSVQFEPGVNPLEMPDLGSAALVRNIYHFENECPFFSQLAKHSRIAGFAGLLINDDPLLFQSMALAKPARIGSEKPWHQDNAYFKYVPLDLIVGVWIALDPAHASNGCMHVLPGWHRRGGLKHTHIRDCQIVPDRLDLQQTQAVELEPGGVLFFAGMLPHQTPPNYSDQRRRALQFHYRGSRTRLVETELYNQEFAESDGTPASCAAASVSN